jgi:chitosanase
MRSTWITTLMTRRRVAVALVVMMLAGVAAATAWWDPLTGANANDSAAAQSLTVAWTGDLGQFPGPAWQQSWGVADAGAYRLDQLQATSDDTAPGGRALAVAYPAGSATPSCTDCPAQGGAQFYTSPPLAGGATLSTATIVDLNYSVKFPSGFDFGRGGMLPGLYGGEIGQESGGQHGHGWSTRLIWRPSAGVVGGGMQLYTGTNTGFGDELGVGRWQFTADGRWHQLEQRIDLTTQTVTLWYDRQQVFSATVSGLTGIPVAGLMFSTFFGGQDTTWGPQSPETAEFAGFTIGTNGKGSAAPGSSATPGQGGHVDLSDPQKKEIALELVSSAENSTLDWRTSFSYIEDIGDGRGYTAGIVGFCSGTGDMLDLVEDYTRREPDNILAPYLPALREVNNTDSHAGLDPDFPRDWRTAANDPVFQEAQESLRDSVYFDPAVRQAQQDGLAALGQFIYFDALIEQGPGEGSTSFGGIRTAAMSTARTPAQGGDQNAYLNAFLDARKAAMMTEKAHSDTSRVDTEQRVFLQAGNLDLNPPLSWKVYGDPYQIALTASDAKATGSSPGASSAGSATSAPASRQGGSSDDGGATTAKYYVTLYGAHDNTPADSRDIAYPVIHDEAGGTGTYQDPLTFATDKAELPVGTIIYYPYLKRYFIMEDDCTECDQDWTGGGPNGGPRFPHIDLWAGASNDSGIDNCEAALTQNGQVDVIIDPPATGLPLDTTPLYDGGRCYPPTGG